MSVPRLDLLTLAALLNLALTSGCGRGGFETMCAFSCFTCQGAACPETCAACFPPTCPFAVGGHDGVAALPRVCIDTTLAPPSGVRIDVPAGGDLQAALDRALPGDLITLAAGATYSGTFYLNNQSTDSRFITVRSAAVGGRRLPPGRRVGPEDSALMATIEGAGSPHIAISAEPGSHHYRFIGLEIRPAARQFTYALISIGAGVTTAAEQPHDLIFDRCYIHGDPVVGGRRAFALNGGATAVIDSYISDWKEAGGYSQGLAGWSGAGPFKIVNNFIEAAGMNILFGGADPAIPGVMPADIEIRDNHLVKRPSWRPGDPAYDGGGWTIDGLLDLQTARRVLVQNNLLENFWYGATGFAVKLRSGSQSGAHPWAVSQDVVLRYNLLRRAEQGMKISGGDQGLGTLSRVVVHDNLFAELGAYASGSAFHFQVLSGVADLIIDHNSVVNSTGTALLFFDGSPNPRFVFTNNIAATLTYGVAGSGFGGGTPAINQFAPGAVFVNNALVGAAVESYPVGNFFPAILENDVGFVDYAGGNYRLSKASPYHDAGSDGRDLGANIDAVAPERLP